jgi:predicted membrane protein
MSINIDDQNPGVTPNPQSNGKILVGLLLMVLGVGFLLEQLDFFFIPHWLFSFPMAMIVWGLYIGARNNFRNSAWIIITLVGLVWISNDIIPGYNLHAIMWPVAIIAFGIWMITRRNHTWDNNKWSKWEGKWDSSKYKNGNPFEPVVTPVAPVEPVNAEGPTVISSTGSTNIPPPESAAYNNPLRGDDYLDAVSVFGGVKKTILSKNFRGGEIVNIFGGAELDFTQADIQGRVVIDITQIFGGTKIIVPSNWQVVSDLAAVFASVDDKRIKTTASPDSNKLLVLKGVSIFAGVDIRSY